MEKIPFDPEAFKNGAVALDEYNNEVIYTGGIDGVSMVHKVMKWRDGESRPDYVNNLFNYVLAFYNDQWSMKPLDKDEGWISHDGGECPIPWATGNNVELKFKNGQIKPVSHYPETAKAFNWSKDLDGFRIIAYRLTDGWIPALNRECPVERDTIIDLRYLSGEIVKNVLCIPDAGGYLKEIVAVRPIKPRLAATDLDEKIYQAIADNYFKRSASRTKTSVPPPVTADDRILARSKTIGMGTYSACKGTNCGCTDGKSHSAECRAEHNKAADAPLDDGIPLTSAYYPMTDDETPQQALTRHAWTRYEAAHPLPQVVPPIGELEIGERIFAALCESLKEEMK